MSLTSLVASLSLATLVALCAMGAFFYPHLTERYSGGHALARELAIERAHESLLINAQGERHE